MTKYANQGQQKNNNASNLGTYCPEDAGKTPNCQKMMKKGSNAPTCACQAPIGPLRTPIFEHTRALRNAAGHPTTDEISSDDAEATLLLFPGFYFFTDELVNALVSLQNK